jgi:hypothetical protein
MDLEILQRVLIVLFHFLHFLHRILKTDVAIYADGPTPSASGRTIKRSLLNILLLFALDRK